jgi:hypothetical protein
MLASPLFAIANAVLRSEGIHERMLWGCRQCSSVTFQLEKSYPSDIGIKILRHIFHSAANKDICKIAKISSIL